MRISIMLTIFVPLMLALLITVFIPTSIMLFSTPIQQGIYRNMKLLNEQIFVRNLLSQEQRIVEKRLQNYENIRNSLMGMFINPQQYQTSSVNPVPAYGLQGSSWQSMWMLAGANATNTAGFSASQNATYSSYQSIEAYNQAMLPELSPTINSTIWTFTNGLLFVFPAAANSMSDQTNIYSYEHNATIQNYNLYKQNYTTNSSSTGAVTICSVVVNGTTLMGTLCLVYNGNNFFGQYLQESIIPETEYLTQVILTSMNTPNQEIPYKVFSFEPNSTTSVNFYTNTPLLTEQQLQQVRLTGFMPYWYQNTTGLLQIAILGTFTYYQQPIMIWTWQQKKVALFMYIIGSDQLVENIQSDFYRDHLMPIILAPSMLFLASCLMSWFILNLIVNRMEREVNVLLEKSNLILKGDLEIEIPEYDGNQELKNVYDKIRILNELVKYCDELYFAGNNSEKSIKYYRALGFFTELKNTRSIAFIHENLSGLCFDQGEFEKAMEYCQLCLTETVDTMLTGYKQFKTIKDLYIYIRSKHKKLPSELRELEVILIRRYSSLIDTLFLCAKESEYPALVEHMQTLLLILKDRPTDNRYIRTVLKMVDLTIRRGDFNQAWQHLEYCEGLIADYDDRYKTELRIRHLKTVGQHPLENSQQDIQDNQSQVPSNYPPEVMYQYMLYLRGLYHENRMDIYQSYSCYRDSFDGDYYHPILRKKIQESLRKLLVSENLFSKELKESVYFGSVDTTTPNEYIFVVDFSTSMKNMMENRDQQRQHFAINQILRIYDDDIRPTDRVSVVKFNTSMDIVFNLTEKSRYNQILRQSIEELKEEVPDGRTALYSTLKVVLSTIQNLKRPKIVIILVDGLDNCSKVRKREIQTMLSQISNLKMIVLGIELDADALEEYYQFLEQHPQGYVVDATDKDYINRIIKVKNYCKKHIEAFIC